MFDQLSTLRLMIALLGSLYLLLCAAAGRQRGLTLSEIALAVSVSSVVALWVFVPNFLAAGQLSLSLVTRRAGLLVGGLGAIARYLAFRRAVEPRLARIASRLSAALLGTGLGTATANWLVMIAMVVVIAAGLFRRAGASPDADSPPSPSQPGSG